MEAKARKRERLENFRSSRDARLRIDLSILSSENQLPLRFDVVIDFFR